MPQIFPADEAVSWPAGEGVIGVVGVAPWATVDFLRVLYQQVDAQKDWHFPRVLCDINTKLPSRGRHFDLGERDPSPYIAQTIAELAQQGATLVVVPCNTAHILYSRWAADAPVKVPSIVEASVQSVPAGTAKVAVFASTSVYKHALYEQALNVAGHAMQPLQQCQIDLISQLIADIKVAGRLPDHLLPAVENLLDELAEEGVGALILGCTELAQLAGLAQSCISCVIDSNTALAREALIGIGMEPSS